jgi:hypothetical protein
MGTDSEPAPSPMFAHFTQPTQINIWAEAMALYLSDHIA